MLESPPSLTPTQSKALRLLLKDCAKGFYQQMYFLGRDVIHPEGNQLIEYGFEKTPSKGLKGTSCYTLEKDGTMIELYGSCACCYTSNSKVAYLRPRARFYEWIAQERCVAGLWNSSDIDASSAQDLFDSTVPLLNWWISYEEWIANKFPPQYRETCHRDWKKAHSSKSWLKPDQAVNWVRAFLENRQTHIRPKNF